MGSVDSCQRWPLEQTAKVVLMLIFAVYCVVQWAVGRTDGVADGEYPYPGGRIFDVVITGGSNALFGVSARQMTGNLGSVSNWALPSEGGGGFDYVDWIKLAGLKTRWVVDSPIKFWYPQEIGRPAATGWLPKQSLLSALKAWMFPAAAAQAAAQAAAAYRKDGTGDLAQHVCHDRFFPLRVTAATLRQTAASSVYFAQRLAAIRVATQAQEVAFRVPPVWVTESTRRRIQPQLQTLLADFRAQGIPVLEQQVILMTDKALFCDASHHPNPVGRAQVTADLVRALLKVD